MEKAEVGEKMVVYGRAVKWWDDRAEEGVVQMES